MRSKTSDAKLTGLFLDMLAAEQGAGPNTLDAYRRDLTDFSEFLARSGQDFAGAETQGLRDYLADLDTRGFKSTSVARRLSAMRHLYRFLLNERIRSDDPAAILSGPKRGRSLPKVLSISDVDRLLGRAKTLAEAPEATAPQRLRALRLHCLLEVLYATGLRVSELVTLPRAAASPVPTPAARWRTAPPAGNRAEAHEAAAAQSLPALRPAFWRAPTGDRHRRSTALSAGRGRASARTG